MEVLDLRSCPAPEQYSEAEERKMRDFEKFCSGFPECTPCPIAKKKGNCYALWCKWVAER